MKEKKFEALKTVENVLENKKLEEVAGGHRISAREFARLDDEAKMKLLESMGLSQDVLMKVSGGTAMENSDKCPERCPMCDSDNTYFVDFSEECLRFVYLCIDCGERFLY